VRIRISQRLSTNSADNWLAATPFGPIRFAHLLREKKVPRTFFSIPQPYRFSLGILRIQECPSGPVHFIHLLRTPKVHWTFSVFPQPRSNRSFAPSIWLSHPFRRCVPTMRRRGPRVSRSAICCRLSLWTAS